MFPTSNGGTVIGIVDLVIGPVLLGVGLVLFFTTWNGFTLLIAGFGIIWIGLIVYLMNDNLERAKAEEKKP